MGFWDFVKKVFGDDSSSSGAPEAGQPASASQAASTPVSQNQSPQPPPASYSPPDILGLSAKDHRKQALKVKPWQSAWNGRFDVIPPASDERTALVDRGLVLAGKITQEELDRLHAVGDSYLKYHQRETAARVEAQRAAQQASDDIRADKARLKAEKKAAAKLKRQEHAEAVAHRKATDIIYLGRGVSRGLCDRRSDIEKLDHAGLPKLASPADVAQLLELSVPQLRWLAYFSEATEKPHYIPFEVPKRRGGTRQLAAPHAKLKAVQQAILRDILEKIPVHQAAHGFVKGKSTVSNADRHIAQAVLVCLDLKDFFPTISFHRVRGLFEYFGYSPAVASVLAALCTEAPRMPITYEGTTYHVAVGDPVLPQGAPTSPALSNLIAHRLDTRLAGFAKKHGWIYTRYADDLTFSGTARLVQKVPALIRMAEQVSREEGFSVHPDKTRVMRKGGQQMVTGIVVNERRSVPRKEIRRLRALLHNAKKTGLQAQNRDAHPCFKEHVAGKIAYVMMVDPQRGRDLKAAFDALPG